MKYQGTDTVVQLGDRVIYRHFLFGKSQGVVAYLPGISKVNPRIIPNQWVVQLDRRKAIFMFHSDNLEFAHKRVMFVARGANDSEIKPDEDI